MRYASIYVIYDNIIPRIGYVAAIRCIIIISRWKRRALHHEEHLVRLPAAVDFPARRDYGRTWRVGVILPLFFVLSIHVTWRNIVASWNFRWARVGRRHGRYTFSSYWLFKSRFSEREELKIARRAGEFRKGSRQWRGRQKERWARREG